MRDLTHFQLDLLCSLVESEIEGAEKRIEKYDSARRRQNAVLRNQEFHRILGTLVTLRDCRAPVNVSGQAPGVGGPLQPVGDSGRETSFPAAAHDLGGASVTRDGG